MRLFGVIVVTLLAYSTIKPQETKPAHDEKRCKQQATSQSPTPSPIGEPDTQSKQSAPYDAGKDYLYRAYLIFTILGVIAGVIGIVAIYKQTEATKDAAIATAKSAKATEDIVKLQEISMKQWVDIEHWEVWLEKRTSTLRIRFQVVNPTSLPMDLHLIELSTRIGSIRTAPHLESFPQTGEVLCPHNPSICDITVALADEETTKLVNMPDMEPIFIAVQCRVIFDSNTRRWEQEFQRAIFFMKADLLALKEHGSLTPEVREWKNSLTEQKKV